MITINPTRNPSLDDGVWTTFRGSKLQIAHTSSLKFQREMARLQAPFRKQIEKGTMDPRDSKEIVVKALSKCILNDWDDVLDQEGSKVSFSRELAYIALSNDEELREFVQEFSTDLTNFRDAEIEEKGNG